MKNKIERRKIKRKIGALVILGMFVLVTMPGIVNATPWDHTGNTNGEDGYLGDTEPYNLIFITDNTPRMRITSGGNVGIGIVPDANVKLDIDTGSNDYGLRLRGAHEDIEIADIYVKSLGQLCFNTQRGTDIEGYFDFYGKDENYGVLIRESDAASTSIWGNIYVKDGGTTGPSSDDYMTFDVNSGAQGTLAVTAGDNVGIGTTSPNRKLEVVSTSTQLRLTRTSTIYTEFTVDSNHDLTITPSSTGQIKLRPTFDSADFFQVLDTDGGTPILNVDAMNERVGIGTASPSAKLHVEGSTVITGSLNVDSATLYVDSTTNRVGIGTTSLGERLTIGGNILFNWGQDRKIWVDTATGTHWDGDDLSIEAGDGYFEPLMMGNRGYNGGDLYLGGGDADGDPGGDGGNVYLYGGAKSDGTDGDVILAHTGSAAQGKVGIGTTGPGKALEINSATGDNLRLTYNDDNGGATNYADFTLASDGSLEIRTDSFDNAFYIDDTNSRVGVGTASPSDTLSVGEKVLISDSTSPSNPPAGAVVIYFDGSDLWAKDSSGNTVRFADFP